MTGAYAQEKKTYNLNTINFKPTIGVGIGMISFYGDISRNTKAGNPLISDIANDFRVSFPLYKGFDIHFYTILGSVSATELSLTRNLNFKSSIFTGGVAAAYNFRHLLPENKYLDPFISLGFESINFNSKTDLHDEFGNTYNYWSDGTIRNLPETTENESISTRLQRDYVYETDIRNLNADAFGDYSLQSFAIPFGIGANLHLNEKIDLRLGTTLHITFNDYMDGITENSIGTRQGTKANDMFLYSAISISYNLTSENSYFGLSRKDLKALDLGDEDDDGVIDFKDNCPFTPAGAPVEKNGCPLDSDKDGVADFKDLEPETAEGATVDSLGQTMTEEQLQEFAKNYTTNDGDGSYSDTAFAVELTDKTTRSSGVGAPAGESSNSVGSSESTNSASSNGNSGAESIEGFNVPVPTYFKGVVYRVQVLAVKSKPSANPFSSINDISAGKFPDGYYRFFAGDYNSKAQAQSRKNSFKANGQDGFVQIFEDGILLPFGQKPKGQPADVSGSSNIETQPDNSAKSDKTTRSSGDGAPAGGSTNSASSNGGSGTKSIEGLNVPGPKYFKGVVYRVQVLAVKPKPRTNPFSSINDISAGKFPDGYYRFFAGDYNSKAQAQSRKNSFKANGQDGFVQIFEDGILLPFGQKPKGQPADVSGSSNIETQPDNSAKSD